MEPLTIAVRFHIGEKRVDYRVQIPQPLQDQLDELLCVSVNSFVYRLMIRGDVETKKDVDGIECWIERNEN